MAHVCHHLVIILVLGGRESFDALRVAPIAGAPREQRVPHSIVVKVVLEMMRILSSCYLAANSYTPEIKNCQLCFMGKIAAILHVMKNVSDSFSRRTRSATQKSLKSSTS